MVCSNWERMEHLSEKKFPVDAKDYKLCEEVGDGVSATVYKALCIPLKKLVAIKVVDLEKCNNGLDGIRREVQTMSLIDHPNVLRAHCSFTTGHKLWVVMPYMAGGSCIHIMKSAYPEGFEEPVIAFLLHEVLKALVYLHSHGHIHRDVKAGNILIDDNGAVKLADFGVSTCMFDTGDRQRSRNTFVGTPCWMAPEVMQQLHGYDFKADIWSLGITALELAHGHAPFSKYPPMKVLLMTLQNAPPGLDYERDKRFSKSFKQMVATCLVKDPQKRPTSEKLLKHQFFKHARSRDYLAPTVLVGLAPLGDRYRMLKAKDAELLMQNKSLYENKDQLSQREYIRGISAWNFNLEDLKSQAALIEDENMPNVGEAAVSRKQRNTNNDADLPAEGLSTSELNHSKEIITEVTQDGFNDSDDMKSSLASFPSKPLQALKGCFDIVEDDVNETSPRRIDQENGKFEDESSGQRSFFRNNVVTEPRIHLSGSSLPDNVLSSKTFTVDSDRDHLLRRYHSERNLSGPLLYRTHKSTSNLSSVDDATEGAVIKCKGRFKVTSAVLCPKTDCVVTPICGGSSSSTNLNLTASSILPSLQSILQHNTVQREEIVKLTKYVEQAPGKHSESVESGQVRPLQVSSATIRERELQSQIYQLQESLGNLLEELQLQKRKNAQLERQLNSNVNKGTRKEEIKQL